MSLQLRKGFIEVAEVKVVLLSVGSGAAVFPVSLRGDIWARLVQARTSLVATKSIRRDFNLAYINLAYMTLLICVNAEKVAMTRWIFCLTPVSF